MGRLFITEREINFINDIAKEVVKDVIGQKIYYFPISEIRSNVHDIYEESHEKIFDSPIEIECLVKYTAPEVRANQSRQRKDNDVASIISKPATFSASIKTRTITILCS